MSELKVVDKEVLELESLKEKAGIMGIQYHSNIGLETLRERVNAALKPKNEPVSEPDKTAAHIAEHMALKRVIVTCLNPTKRELEGEIFTISNGILGDVRMYVPYGNDEGWHIPKVIVEDLKTRKCQIFQTVLDKATGKKHRKPKMIKAFSIVELPALTKDEIEELTQRQALAGSID